MRPLFLILLNSLFLFSLNLMASEPSEATTTGQVNGEVVSTDSVRSDEPNRIAIATPENIATHYKLFEGSDLSGLKFSLVEEANRIDSADLGLDDQSQDGPCTLIKLESKNSSLSMGPCGQLDDLKSKSAFFNELIKIAQTQNLKLAINLNPDFGAPGDNDVVLIVPTISEVDEMVKQIESQVGPNNKTWLSEL